MLLSSSSSWNTFAVINLTASAIDAEAYTLSLSSYCSVHRHYLFCISGPLFFSVGSLWFISQNSKKSSSFEIEYAIAEYNIYNNYNDECNNNNTITTMGSSELIATSFQKECLDMIWRHVIGCRGRVPVCNWRTPATDFPPKGLLFSRRYVFWQLGVSGKKICSYKSNYESKLLSHSN